jgi:hypothetical protein
VSDAGLPGARMRSSGHPPARPPRRVFEAAVAVGPRRAYASSTVPHGNSGSDSEPYWPEHTRYAGAPGFRCLPARRRHSQRAGTAAAPHASASCRTPRRLPTVSVTDLESCRRPSGRLELQDSLVVRGSPGCGVCFPAMPVPNVPHCRFRFHGAAVQALPAFPHWRCPVPTLTEKLSGNLVSPQRHV